MPIDQGLIDDVRNGRAVLFLGAGASLGAEDGQGHKIPGTDDLGKLIRDEFLDDTYAHLDFIQICDFAATARSSRELQKFIHDTLEPFQPAPFHKKIPTFYWAGLATTNFDLIVERAYIAQPNKLQNLRPLLRDTPDFMDSLQRNDVTYVKLHGCITTHEQTNPGMVFSTERIVRHKEGRASQFSQLLEWAKTKTLIFAGYSLRDFNLRYLLDEIVRDGDTRPKHYVIKKGVLAAEKQYWAERRFIFLDSPFEDFINELDIAIPENVRKLAVARSTAPTSLTKFIASSRQESTTLKNYIQTGAEHVTTETTSPSGNAQKFFNGFDQGWYPIEAGLDVPRQLSDTILQEEIVIPHTSGAPHLVVLKAHAGAGKSVALRRLAWEAARRLGKVVFFIPASGYVNIQAIQEIAELTQETVYIFIEDITLVSDAIAALIASVKGTKRHLVIVGGARFNEWNIRSQSLETAVSAEYELKYLTHREAEGLLEKLEKSDCLGELKHLPQDQRLKKFEEVYGRQLLVALHEATRNSQFREIILNEYKNIVPAEAQVLYADICALHRFGSPVRAGLISRVHGIGFEQFQDRFFKPLEQVVALEMDGRSGDWVYRARHPYIAEILYLQVFSTAQERFDNHVKLISRLNPAYSYDRRIIADLLRGNKLADAFPEIRMGIAIYETALEALGEDAHLYHQQGIYLMRRAGSIGDLTLSEQALDAASELAPTDRTIKHSLAELALTRAKLSKDAIERAAWRNEAIAKAQPLAGSSNASHAYHTIAKARIQALNDAIDNESDDPLAIDAVNDAIRAAEDAVRTGLKRFPGDSHLLAEEAILASLLENDERAERALGRAFESNKQSPLIAKRYALILKVRNKLAEAKEVLRQALENHPGSQDLNFDFAQVCRLIEPAIDVTQPEMLLSYYQRSFTKGDKNYRAQLLCARQLTLAGRLSDAKQLFDHLKNAAVPYSEKGAVKEEVREENGDIRIFNGEVVSRRDSYGLAQLDTHQIVCLFNAKSLDGTEHLPTLGTRIQTNLGFTFFGPTAFNLKEIS
ncbi:P-loop NTPase [Pseudoxanthomonas mexicana]